MNLPRPDDVIAVIAELTACSRVPWQERLRTLTFSTPLVDQIALLEFLERKLGVKISVECPFRTTVGEVIQGMKAA